MAVMTVSVRHVLHQGPMLGALGHTAYLALRQRMASGNGDAAHAPLPTLPGPEIHRRMQAPPRALIEDYVRFLGGDPRAYRNEVPPHLFPQWCMPALAHTLDGLPYPVLRVLNGGCRVRVSAPLPQGERYEVRARLQQIDDDGRRAVLHQHVSCGPRSAPDALEIDVYAIVPLGGSKEAAGGKEGNGKGNGKTKGTPGVRAKAKAAARERPRVATAAREVARLKLGRDAGVQYAKLTGDFNPIHWLRPFARAAGFPSVILHGFGTLAFAWETLNRSVFAGDVRAIDMVDVKFARALVLPHEVGLYVAEQQMFVGDAPGGPSYLTGTLAARGMIV
jgi:hypothetical protein